MAKVSVVINTFNEESHLPGCVESVRWADDIVVVDMHSTDRTVALAEQLGCRVFLHAYEGYVEPARNFAISQAKHDWVLVLDADERASAGLAEWIDNELDRTDAAGLRIPRRNFYGRTWITCCGWFPDDQLRLYRKDSVHYSDRIHRAPDIDGCIEVLPLRGEAYLLHYSFANLGSRVAKTNQYATISAKAMSEEGKRIGGLGLFSRTAASFFSAYLLQKGFRFGGLGVMLALERACATFLKYGKLWEMNQQIAEDETP